MGIQSIGKEKIMDESLIDLGDLQDALEELKGKKTVMDESMSEEMEASQRRYEEYIKKNQSE